LAEGGAEDAHGAKAMGLDFKVYGAERFHGGYTIRAIDIYVNSVMYLVWLHMKH
jgi:hypothetical protein